MDVYADESAPPSASRGMETFSAHDNYVSWRTDRVMDETGALLDGGIDNGLTVFGGELRPIIRQI